MSQQNEKSVAAIVAGVAHDVQSPTAAVHSNLSVLQSEAAKVAAGIAQLRRRLEGECGPQLTAVLDAVLAEHRLDERLAIIFEVCDDSILAARKISETLRALTPQVAFEEDAPTEGARTESREVPRFRRGSILTRRSCRVLIVEDNEMIRRATTRVLEPPHSVVSACNGAEALEVLRTGATFDVILCDMAMPLVDGPSFFRRVRDEYPAAVERIVFMSGGVIDARSEQFLVEEDPIVLAKPVGRDLLLAVIDRVGAGETSELRALQAHPS